MRQLKELLKFIMPLVIVCIISAVALTYTYSVTEPVIQDNQLGELKESLKEVVPADSFQKLDDEIIAEGIVVEQLFEARGVGDHYVAAIVSVPGYQDNIRLLIGIELQQKTITRTIVLENSETPGLGTGVTEQSCLGQFENKAPGSQFDTISGATISSSAVIKGVNIAAETILDKYAGNQK